MKATIGFIFLFLASMAFEAYAGGGGDYTGQGQERKRRIRSARKSASSRYRLRSRNKSRRAKLAAKRRSVRRYQARAAKRPARRRSTVAASAPPKKQTMPKPVAAKAPTPPPANPASPASANATRLVPVDKRPEIPLWRGWVKLTQAEPSAGIEQFSNLSALLATLPDDGEIRVRYGIYAGTKTRNLQQRLPEEQRVVRVSCWLYAVRMETVPGGNEIRMILGSTDNPRTAWFLAAELPLVDRFTNPANIRSYIPSATIEAMARARAGLESLLPGVQIPSEYLQLTPRPIEVEGSLFFDGKTGVGRLDDAGPEDVVPRTVWKIHPVTAISSAVAGSKG